MRKIILQSDTVVAFCNQKLTPYSKESELMYECDGLIRIDDENVESHHD